MPLAQPQRPTAFVEWSSFAAPRYPSTFGAWLRSNRKIPKLYKELRSLGARPIGAAFGPSDQASHRFRTIVGADVEEELPQVECSIGQDSVPESGPIGWDSGDGST